MGYMVTSSFRPTPSHKRTWCAAVSRSSKAWRLAARGFSNLAARWFPPRTNVCHVMHPANGQIPDVPNFGKNMTLLSNWTLIHGLSENRVPMGNPKILFIHHHCPHHDSSVEFITRCDWWDRFCWNSPLTWPFTVTPNEVGNLESLGGHHGIFISWTRAKFLAWLL